MRIKLLTFVIALFALIACNKPTFNVKVDLKNAEGKMIYLQKFVDKKYITIDSAIIQNNVVNFIVEEGNPSTNYTIVINGVKNVIGFFSENKDVEIIGDINDDKNITITASYAQQRMNEYFEEIKRFSNQLGALRIDYDIAVQAKDILAIEKVEKECQRVYENRQEYITFFITQNNSNIISPYILYQNRFNYELHELEDFVNNFKIKQDNEYLKILNEYISELKRVSVGQPYIDFTQETPEGNLLSLSELVGKSKLLLVDFWASWCEPCRKENPNVVAVYNDYHEKGFDVLSVSLDMQKENWVKAIEKDGLIWHNVSDLKYGNNEVTKVYKINLIPSNILLDENGVIIAKNLIGEDLRSKVEEILN